MDMTRRDFMGGAAALALLAEAAMGPEALAAGMQAATGSGLVDVRDFWADFYSHTLSTRGANEAPLARQGRKTVYLHSPAAGGSLGFAENLPLSSLPAIDGDVAVKMAISQYRPAKGDISTDVTHLRIDASQTFDYMNVVAPSVWAVIASLIPDKNATKMPTLDQMGFHAQTEGKGDPNQVSQLLLPNGVGKFAVNVTKSAQDSTFSKVLMTIFEAGTSLFPLLTIPQISVPAAKAITEILGKWQGHASVVMNGNLRPVIATSKLPDGVLPPQDPMPLATGYYIMVPTDHQPELQSDLDKLTVQNGFLVHKDASASDDLLTRAAKAVPGVSYATLRVNVEKAPANGCGVGTKKAEPGKA